MAHNKVNAQKRKRGARSTTDDTTLVKSFSQISISQPTTKKACRSPTHNGLKNKTQETHASNAKSNKPSKDVPDYLTVPDAVFKQQLLAEVTSDRTSIERWLETDAMLQYTRECARLTNDVCYWKEEQNFWNIYASTAMTEADWLSKVPIQTIKENHIHWSYCKTAKNVEKRRKTIQKHGETAAQKLSEYFQQLLPILLQPSQQPSIDINVLSSAILSFVQKGQQRLRDDFKRKEAALKLDISDVRLVKSFLEMHPTDAQV